MSTDACLWRGCGGFVLNVFMHSSYSKRLVSNFIALGIVQGTNFLLPIIVIPFVISRIGTDGFGAVSVVQVIMMFFTNVSDYGFNLTATRDVSINRENNDLLSKIFFTVLFTRLVICFLLFGVLLLSVLVIPIVQTHSELYLLSFVSVIGQSLLINWLFQGVEKMKFVMYITLLARVVFVILVFAFIREKSDYVYFLFFSGIGNLLAGILSIAAGYKFLKLKTVIPTVSDITTELKKGWHITVSNLSVSAYTYLNVLILRLFTNDTVVGYYSVAERIVFAGRQILSIYFQAIYPQVCRIALQSREEVSSFFLHYYRPFLACVLAGCCLLFFFANPIVALFLGHDVPAAAEYLRVLSLVPFIVCLNIPAYQMLLVHNKRKSLLLVFAVGTTLNIASSFLLVPSLSALGTSYVVLLTEVSITLGLILAMFRNHGTKVRFMF